MANFIASTASVMGRVFIGKDVSIWYGAVIRADVEEIHLGEACNIQDNAVLHADEGDKTNGKKVGSKLGNEKEEADDDDLDEMETKKSKSSAKSKKDDDDDDDDVDVKDDWDAVEEDDNWDPDFDEFEMPKSKNKKSPSKKSSKSDDDFDADDDFKDLDLFDDDMNGGGFDDDF